MSALTKSEMADKLFEELGLNKREAKELVEQFFEEIRICLENNEQVKLSASATLIFEIKARAPVVIRRRVKRSLFLLDVLLPSSPDKSSKPG